ncbi:hypothetical protein LINPERPRIM_LOCUS3522 [Linum perenne]
MGWEHQMLL